MTFEDALRQAYQAGRAWGRDEEADLPPLVETEDEAVARLLGELPPAV